MSTRLIHKDIAPGGYKSILGIEKFVATSDLEPELLDLVRLLSSQINGCAFCLVMHAHDLRTKYQVSERHIDLLPAWRESDDFTPREKAALGWTEAVTKLTNKEVPDEIYNEALAEFGEKGLVELTFAVIAINSWNRVNVAFHTPPPVYEDSDSLAKAAD
jgi:AhpD family alkylhydroperoxidase